MSLQFNMATGADGTESITATVEGSFFTADSSHPNYGEIKAALLDRLIHGNGDPEDGSIPPRSDYRSDDAIKDLFDLSFRIGQRFEEISESGRLTVSGGRIFFDGNEVNDVLTQQIVAFHREGVEDWKPLVRFFEKIKTNPNEHSQTYLYNWLQAHQFTIADDGDIIAYKSVRKEDYKSTHSGPGMVNGVWTDPGEGIENKPGNVITLPREQVVHNPSDTCSFGLHAATFDFARRFHSGPVMKLKINPRDVVSVPVDANGEKMRVCRYIVIEEAEGPIETLVDDTLDDEFLDYEDEDYAEEYDEDDLGNAEDAADEQLIADIERSVAHTETLVERMKRRLGFGGL